MSSSFVPLADGASLPVMRVVIGGVASRHALSVDRLDDLQLAVETLFREEPAERGRSDPRRSRSSRWRVQGDVWPGSRSPLVRRALSGGAGSRGDTFGAQNILRMIMDSLVDGYRMAEEPRPARSPSRWRNGSLVGVHERQRTARPGAAGVTMAFGDGPKTMSGA